MTSTITQPREKKKRKTKGTPPYNVILLDDDDHSFEYVIHMLKTLFGHPPEKGYKMAVEVDTKGRVVVATTHLEEAELKRDPGFRTRSTHPTLQGLDVCDARTGIRLIPPVRYLSC
jgi:ATP-dependent Clp protease adaptor protein ClpS